MTGYYASTTEPVCVKCNLACDSCSSATQCTSCKASDDTRLTAAEGCLCKTGYYDNGELICAKCNNECLTCKDSAEKCESC